LSLAQWGRWDDEVPPALLAELQMSYARRKRWEGQLLAREIVAALGVALSGKGAGRGTGMRMGASGKVYREITPEEALKLGT